MAQIKVAFCFVLMTVAILEGKLVSAEGCDDKFNKSPQCNQMLTEWGMECTDPINDGEGTVNDICEKACDEACAGDTEEEKRGKTAERAQQFFVRKLSDVRGAKRGQTVERAQHWIFEARREECENQDDQCVDLVASQGIEICDENVYSGDETPKKIKDFCNLSCRVCTPTSA